MKITSIKRVKPKRVYALQTSTGTFIADGLAHHNCVGCNVFGNGKILDFEEKLKYEIGVKEVERIKSLRHQVLKVDEDWYKVQIAHYQDKLERLL